MFKTFSYYSDLAQIYYRNAFQNMKYESIPLLHAKKVKGLIKDHKIDILLDKNLLTYGQFVIIECTDKKIEFKCKGSSNNLGNARKEFEHDPNGEDGTVNIKVHPKKNKNEPIIIREIYDLNI
jgi:uncharacterized protein YpbB